LKADVLVVGGGLGGYPAAVNLARKGYRVILIEKNLLGGECTNYGCVPSKAWYHVAEGIRALKKVGGEARVDWGSIAKWVEELVSSTRSSLEELLKRYGVEVVYGRAVFKKHGYAVAGETGIEYDKLVLALGTDPKPLPGYSFDGRVVVSNRELFYTGEEFDTMVIVGGA